MPPSGFSQKAINGLLGFVRANYEVVAERYRDELLTEQEFLERTSDDLENQVKTVLTERFPESERLNGGVQGLTTFVVECYKDLAQEIVSGQDKHDRPVIDGKAIQKELDQIGTYLTDFKI
ncbi:MAG: hypothetical protein CMH63_02145 [Nanoarchaeota archaeon]|jgi:hypothetical protein|nr:hypothetical protein [Nanoarchaeota archaeon]|tara:strand:- start:16994 stop:17356 length:363 start_codon:yes stop_codon:yes gene_type:complete